MRTLNLNEMSFVSLGSDGGSAGDGEQYPGYGPSGDCDVAWGSAVAATARYLGRIIMEGLAFDAVKNAVTTPGAGAGSGSGSTSTYPSNSSDGSSTGQNNPGQTDGQNGSAGS